MPNETREPDIYETAAAAYDRAVNAALGNPAGSVGLQPMAIVPSFRAAVDAARAYALREAAAAVRRAGDKRGGMLAAGMRGAAAAIEDLARTGTEKISE